MNGLEKYTWQQLYAQYRQYANRLKEIERYFKVLPDKKPLSATPGAITPSANDYQERLMLNAAQIDNKLAVLDAEITRRNQLIGVVG